MIDEQTEEFEQRIYETQEILIKAAYGDEAATHANYGWAVVIDPDKVGICTKIYLQTGAMLLLSELGADGIICHEWAKY